MKNNIQHKKLLRGIATMAMLLYLVLPAATHTEAQLLKVLPGNGNASKQTGPQGALRFQRGFYLVSPKEMLASGLASGSTVNKIGFTIAYPQSDTTRGLVRIYLQNTADTVSRYDSNWTEISVSDAYYWLSGLYPAKYEWQVKTNCTGSSAYTESNLFANDNLDPCLSPTSLRTTSITNNSATLRWVPPANTVGKFVVEYKAKDDADWTTDSTASDHYDLTGLYSDSSYNWRVYARCNPDSSTYAHSSFVTADDSNCDLPTGLSATVIDDTSATISWTAVTGANYYNIRYRRLGVNEWIVLSAFTNSFTIDTLLDVGSTYEWQVQTACTSGKSYFADGSNFTTTGTLSCYRPTQLFVDSISTTAARLSWQAASGATGYTVRYRPKETIKWLNAVTPMTLVSQDSVYVPDSIGVFEIPFANGDPFTYTGDGVYVAFEYERSTGDLPIAGNYISTDAGAWSKGSQGQDSIRNQRSFVSRQDSSLAEQDTVLSVSDLRPETFFGSPSLIDSVEVSSVYALGNIIPGTANKVDAVISSFMVETPSVNVSLNVINKATSAVKYSTSTLVVLNASDTTMVSFMLPDQPVGETDSIVVSVPAQGTENILENNSFAYLQTFTNSILGYNDGSSNIGSAGCDTLEGLTLIKIPLKDCSQAIGVKAFLSDEAKGHELYAVLLDVTGAIVAQSLPFTPGEDDVNNYHSFYFSVPAAVSVDSFYAGIAQMASAEGFAPVGVEWEGTMIRDSAYYRAKTNGDSLTQTKLPGRLKISVELTKAGDYVTIDGSNTLCASSTETLTAAKINARYADSVIAYSSQNNAFKFSANQTLGAPNVYPSYTLSENSWIGSTSSTQQYITLRFPGDAPINYVDIYETYNPGAVDSVYVLNPGTSMYELVFDTTASPKASKARINRIKFPTTAFNVTQVRIHLSPLSDPAKGFNAIDAVSIGTITSPGTFDTYLWSPGGETTQSITINSAGTYTLQTTSSGECDGIDSIEVTTPVQVTPVITALGPSTFCAGDSVTLSIDQDFGIMWSTGETSKTIVVKTAGDYSATFDDGSGCGTTTSNTISVSVDTIPTISISGPTEVCPGGNIQLSATAGLTSYFWSAGSVSNTATVLNPGTYWVTGTNSFGCKGTDTTTISQAVIADPSITGSLSFCPGDSTMLDAGDGYSEYNWSNGETTQTIYAKLAGDYSVSVKNTSGCQGSVSVTTTNYASPTAAITGNLNFCPGGSTSLDAGSGFASYLWSTGASSQTINANASGNYKVVVSNTDGCKDSIDVYVGTFANPVPKITGQLGICPSGSTTLTATPGYASYQWTPGPSTSNQAIISTLGLVTVVVTDANGCTGSASATTIARTLAAPVISGTLSFCAGNSTALDAGPGYASYSWSTGETTQAISVEDVDTYTVTVEDIYGCSASASATTSTNNALPVPPGPITGPGLGVCGMTDQVYSINPVSNTNFYVWFLPDGASFADNDTSSTTVKINFGAGFNGGKLTVAANNVCGQSAAINPTYINVGTYAATPASINGPTNGICGPVTKNYSVVPATTGATYTWTAPPNASITSGQGTATVSILFSSAFTNGDVCVKATTICGGTSPSKCLTVRKEIAPIGAISGATTVCTKQAGVVYSIAPVPGATSYTWTATNSATIVAGQGTTSVKVDWNSKAGSVSVIANSACGSTTPKTLNVNMTNCGGGNVMTQNAVPAASGEVRLEPEVVANDGGDVTTGNINLQWTLGEPMVETMNGRGRIFSQGFHQPTIMVLRNPKDSLITDKGLRIIAAPNPVFTILKVHIFAEEETPLNLQLTNVLGNMKLNIPVKALTNTVEIKMDTYPQGVYFLTVQDKKGKTIKVIKILKL